MPDSLTKPRVSVVIPTHNRPQLLPRAINSVLEQSLQDFEIIVVDDGSHTPVEKLVLGIGDPRIRYLKNEIPLGGGGARNRGIGAARADIIAFLDDDDEWDTTKLKKQVTALEQAPPQVSLVFSGVRAVNDAGAELYTRLPKVTGQYHPLVPTLNKCFIWTSALAVRTSFLRQVHGFDATLRKNQEWDLQIRLLAISDFFALNEPLTTVHILADDAHMGGRGNMANIIFGYNQFLKKHRTLYLQHPVAYAKRLFHVATLYRDWEKHWCATYYRFLALSLQPLNMVYIRHAALSLLGPYVYNWFRQRYGESLV